MNRAHVASRWAYRTLMARRLIDGPPVAPSDGVRWLASQCVERTIDRWDAVVAVTGEEGVSKSTFALRFVLEAQAYAASVGITNARWSFDRLCYSARDVMNAYRNAPRSSVIWYDEGARGLLAGETFTPEQIVLTKALMLIRETGAILIVCIPDIFALAKKVRGRRATYWVHVTKRGTKRNPAPSEAVVHERDRKLKYLPTKALGLSVSRRCPALTYPPIDEESPDWASYLKAKHAKLDEFYIETDAVLDRADRALFGKNPSERPAERRRSGGT